MKEKQEKPWNPPSIWKNDGSRQSKFVFGTRSTIIAGGAMAKAVQRRLSEDVLCFWNAWK